MKQWYLCKLKCTRLLENGREKKELEQYLVDAQSFTEAEARVAALMAESKPREYETTAIQKERYEEVRPLPPDDPAAADGKWHKVRLAHVVLNEKTGRERKTWHNHLLQSTGTADAERRLHDMMRGSLLDYRVYKVEETPILEVLQYQDPATEEQAR